MLGKEYVDKALASADDFNQDFQDLLNEYCWGFAWTREGLSRKTRSMLNIALLSALGRSHELALHVRGAINNGVTKEEIREVLIHTAIYAGVPASVEGFRVAREALKDTDA